MRRSIVLAPYIVSKAYILSTEQEREAIASLKGYHYNEPWSSPKNQQWAKNNPGLEIVWMRFICPTEIEYDQQIGLCPNADRAIKLGQNPFAAHYITYLMLVHPDSSLPLPDDAVIVVESLGCGVRFQEPKDISLDDLLKEDSPFGLGKLNSLHPNVVKALRVDGEVIDIPKNITKEDLRKLLQGKRVNRGKVTGN